MPQYKHLYYTGMPHDILIVGPLRFIPWMEPVGSNGAWKIFEDEWRSPFNQRLTYAQIKVFAQRKGYEVLIREFIPALIDEDELAEEERILYGEE